MMKTSREVWKSYLRECCSFSFFPFWSGRVGLGGGGGLRQERSGAAGRAERKPEQQPEEEIAGRDDEVTEGGACVCVCSALKK